MQFGASLGQILNATAETEGSHFAIQHQLGVSPVRPTANLRGEPSLNWCGTKWGPQKLVAKPPFAVILKTYFVNREVYLVRKTRYEFIKKGRGNGGE